MSQIAVKFLSPVKFLTHDIPENIECLDELWQGQRSEQPCISMGTEGNRNSIRNKDFTVAQLVLRNKVGNQEGSHVYISSLPNLQLKLRRHHLNMCWRHPARHYNTPMLHFGPYVTFWPCGHAHKWTPPTLPMQPHPHPTPCHGPKVNLGGKALKKKKNK